MTIVDLSPQMLAQSRELNPECEHLTGDMRTVRLGREFDRVFIHDAICSIETAFVHCRPGGVAFFAPDWVCETFSPGADHGGSDGPDRSLRFLKWTWDPDPLDSEYIVDYVYALRDANGSVTVEHDRHIEGIFSREQWLQSLRAAGFEPRADLARHSEVERPLDLFVGVKPTL